MKKQCAFKKIRSLWYKAKFVGVIKKRKDAAEAKRNM
jgi:hypothetical protein